MCGILAKLSHDGAIDLADFKNQLSRQSHRGPDGQKTWISDDQSVALGHNLLSLTGQKNSQQPFFNETRTIIASVNGEFYGHQEIRTILEKNGHRFYSDSDSEILVHLYEEHGLESVQFLRGEFVFAIWDTIKQRLFCARDRFGIKPLHYQRNRHGLTVASEAKTIINEEKNPRWSQESLMQAFTHQYLSPEQSLFEGIQQLPPAHILCYKNNSLHISRYWHPDPVTEELCSPESLLESLNSSLVDRLHPHAAFSLSGGIDSSAIVALASNHLQKDVPAFSVSFDETSYDEIELVRSKARELGATVNKVSVSRNDLLTKLPEAVTMSEGLAINGQLVGKHLLNQAVQDAGYRVIISGEGADEALLGYAHVVADSAQASPSIHPLQKGIMLPNGETKITTPLPPWLQQWPSFLKAKIQFCQQFSDLLKSDFLDNLKTCDPLSNTMDQIDCLGMTLPYRDQPHQSAWLWTRMALANSILKILGDGSEMPYSIEGRVPFLDHVFFEKSWKIPTSQKIRNGQSKAIFRKAVERMIPSDIAFREKHPFLAPPILGERNTFETIKEIFHDHHFANLNFIDQPSVLTWFDRIEESNPTEQQKADPIIHTLLSMLFLQNSYKLSL